MPLPDGEGALHESGFEHDGLLGQRPIEPRGEAIVAGSDELLRVVALLVVEVVLFRHLGSALHVQHPCTPLDHFDRCAFTTQASQFVDVVLSSYREHLHDEGLLPRHVPVFHRAGVRELRWKFVHFSREKFTEWTRTQLLRVAPFLGDVLSGAELDATSWPETRDCCRRYRYTADVSSAVQAVSAGYAAAVARSWRRDALPT